jgi:hypothetical protein
MIEAILVIAAFGSVAVAVATVITTLIGIKKANSEKNND